jgi:DNA polymerase elongation subunit (family B)
MLIDYQYINNYLVCSYVTDKGDIGLYNIKWNNPMNWVECSIDDPDAHPQYKTWDGCAVKQVPVKKPNKHSVSYFLYEQPEEIRNMLFRSVKPNKMYIDIETEIVSGFPSPKLAPTRILTIATVFDLDKVVFLSLKELSGEEKVRIKEKTNEYVKKFGVSYKFKFIHFEKEHNMLLYFFENLVKRATILSGWNVINFDWQFLINRCKNLGIYDTINNNRWLSPSKSFLPYDGDFILPRHKEVIDYMEVYVKYQQEVKVKESTSLDFVAEKLLKVKKIEYSGSLMELYNNDFETYAYYNIVDTLLVKIIDDEKKYFDIMISIAEASRTRFKDAMGTVTPTEGFVRDMMLKMHNIVFVSNKIPNIEEVSGGWVKERENTLLNWVSVFDFASLYPTTQRQNYIAPENFIGNVDSTGEYAIYNYPLLGEVKTKIDKNIHIITNRGSVFIKRKSATIIFLEETYNKRKLNKKKASEAFKKIEKLKKLKEILYNK